MKKIAVIGVGGRTGTMFFSELRKSADVLGVAKEREVRLVEEKNLYIERNKESPELLKGRIIKDTEFQEKLKPDIIFLTTKNPVSTPIKYYFQRCKEKIPALILSQNGIDALLAAKESLEQVLGQESEKVRLVRMVLFNPIDKRESEDKIYIKYSLPIKIALAKASGKGEIKDIVDILKRAGFEIKEFHSSDAKNLEFSKLFLNLIGMAAASRGLPVRKGFENKEIFKEEIKALKEYIKTVKLSKGRFLNFPHYPVGFLADLFGFLPVSFLLPFRNILAGIVSKGREGKPKDLNEIDYYNGAVVSLGKKIGVLTPINEKVYKRALERLNRT